MIKNIIFDIGNVILYFQPHNYLAEKYHNPQFEKELLEQIFISDEWMEENNGLIDNAELIRKLCEKHPKNSEKINDICHNWVKSLTPIESTFELIRKLKETGKYKLFILSNTAEYHYESYKHHNVFSLFDGQILSFKVGKVKPSKEILDELINQYDIVPSESLIIDDIEENVLIAKENGFHVIHLTNPDGLPEELAKMNII